MKTLFQANASQLKVLTLEKQKYREDGSISYIWNRILSGSNQTSIIFAKQIAGRLFLNYSKTSQLRRFSGTFI